MFSLCFASLIYMRREHVAAFFVSLDLCPGLRGLVDHFGRVSVLVSVLMLGRGRSVVEYTAEADG